MPTIPATEDNSILVQAAIYRDRGGAVIQVPTDSLGLQCIGGIFYQINPDGTKTPLGAGITGITALTTDVVAVGSGSVPATIQPQAVTYAKIQNVGATCLLGNSTGSPASVAELSPATARTLLGLAAIATSGSASDLTSGTVAVARLATSGVSAGTYTGPYTVDVAGRVTAATNLALTAAQVVYGASGGGFAQAAGLTYTAGTGQLAVDSAALSSIPLKVSANANPSIDWYENGSRVANIVSSLSGGGQIKVFATAANAQFSIAGTQSAFSVFTTDRDVYLCGVADLATNTATGFFWPPTTLGVPTGTPTHTINNKVPLIIDATNKRLYGYLGSAWHYASFDDGAASAGITALTGDVTATGPGSAAATIAANAVTTAKINNNAVTLAKLATQADQTILGNTSGGAAVPVALTAAQTWGILATKAISILPVTDVTYNLGSGSFTWASLYAQTVRTPAITSGGTGLTLSTGSTAAISLQGTGITTTGTIVPTVTATDDLGSTSATWFRIFSATVEAGIVRPPADATYDLGATNRQWVNVFGTAFKNNNNPSSISMSGTTVGTLQAQSGSTWNATYSGVGRWVIDSVGIGFMNQATGVAVQTSGANLTNNVTAGGTTDTIANYTDLVVYANDAAAIRNDIYQISRKLKQINDGLRAFGLFT